MDILDELRGKKSITRDDIERLLESIGEPGDKHQEKIDAVKLLNKPNRRSIKIEDTIEGYRGF